MASAGVNGKGNFIIKPELEIRTSWGGTSMGSDGLSTTRNVDEDEDEDQDGGGPWG